MTAKGSAAKTRRSKATELDRVPSDGGNDRARADRGSLSETRRSCERLAAVEQVATVMAHDLRNYLGTIRNASYLLGQSITEAPSGQDLGVGEILQILDRAISSCSNLVSEFAEATRRPHRPQPTLLAPLVQDALALVTIPAHVTVTVEIDDQLPAVEMHRDEVLVALVNLIQNATAAIPAARPGCVRISGSLTERDLYIRITDDGQGFPTGLVDKIGRPIIAARSPASGGQEGPGLGLGLSIVANIVKRHGGALTAERQPQLGTTFVMRLPRKAAEPLTATTQLASL